MYRERHTLCMKKILYDTVDKSRGLSPIIRSQSPNPTPSSRGVQKSSAQRVFTEFDLSAGFDLQDYPPVKRWSDKNTQLRTRDLTLRNPPVSGGVIKSQFKPPSPSPHHNTTHHCGSPVKEAGYTQEEEEEEEGAYIVRSNFF